MIFHIGHGKTGTSSIQRYLKRSSLNENCDFAYPKTMMSEDGGHHGLFNGSQKQYNALYNELNNSKQNNVIISSESGLPNMRHFIEESDYKSHFFTKLSEEHNVFVVYYVRNHFDILESAFLQHIQNSDTELNDLLESGHQDAKLIAQERFIQHYFNNSISPEKWIDTAPTRQFDFYSNLFDFWESVASKTRIITKIYSRNSLLNQDIVCDFLSLLPFETKLTDFKEHDINPTSVYTHFPRHFVYNQESIERVRYTFSDSVDRYCERYLAPLASQNLKRGF